MTNRIGDLEERLRTEWPESIPAGLPNDLVAEVQHAVRRTPQPRPRRVEFVFGLAAAAIAAIAVFTLRLAGVGSGSATPTPVQTSPSALNPGTVAEAVASFSLVTDRRVQIGQRVFVVDGPVLRDGEPSYLLQHWGDLEFGLRPDSDFGWLPASDAEASLRPIEVACPDGDPTLSEAAALQVFERPMCFRDRDLTFEPVTATSFSPSGGSQLWISMDGRPDFLTALQVYPVTGVHLSAGTWMRVTGHFGDSSSSECAGLIEEARCRQRFVVTAASQVEPPEFVLRGEWRQTAYPSIGGRTGHVMSWTGSEVLVWGGTESAEDVPAFHPSYGAAYNPETDSWRRIPEAPIPGRYRPVAAWDGSELLVWGGSVVDAHDRRFLTDGAAYDPVSDRWRVLPQAPMSGGEAVGGWYADRFVLVTNDGAARYDPEDNQWEPLNPAPIRPGWRSAAVANDRLVIIAFGDGATGRVEGAVLEPDGSWVPIEVPLDPLDAGTEFVSAGDVVLAPSAGQALNPATGIWTQVAQCPGAANGGTWTGTLVLGVTGAYDPARDACLNLPPAPPRAPPFDGTNGREFAAGVWSGSEYITWSGGNFGDLVWIPNDGALFRPGQ